MLLPIIGIAAIAALFLGGRKKSDPLIGPSVPNILVPPPVTVPSGTDPGGSIVVPSPDTPAQEQEVINSSESAATQDWQAAVAQAIQGNDAAQLEQIAKTMSAAGLTVQAASVLAVVAAMRAAALAATNEVRNTTGELPLTQPEIQAMESEPVVTVDPRITLAAKLVEYINSTSKGKENRETIKKAQEALGELVTDGLYGLDTALRVAWFGIVPAVPWYLPTKDTVAKVAAFKATMKQYAAADPARAVAWLNVANKVNF